MRRAPRHAHRHTRLGGRERAPAGEHFDGTRIARFEVLHDHLRAQAPRPPRPSALAGDATANHAFFEAYFSNFIEGTEFAVEEAVAIVFGGRIPAERPEDAHAITGTFAVVSDPA